MSRLCCRGVTSADDSDVERLLRDMASRLPSPSAQRKGCERLAQAAPEQLAGAAPAVTAAMEAHCQDAGVQQAGCDALCAIAAGGWLDSLLAAGSVAAILAAMAAHCDSPEVQQVSCKAVQGLLVHEGDLPALKTAAQQLQEGGFIQEVLRAIQTHAEDQRVLCSGSGALAYLSDHYILEVWELMHECDGEGVIPILVRQMAALSEELKPGSPEVDMAFSCLALFANASAGSEAARKALVQAGAVPGVLRALQFGMRDEAICSVGVMLVWNLAIGSADIKAEIVKERGMMEALAGAANATRGTDSHLQCLGFASHALAALVDVSAEHRANLLNSDAILLVSQVLVEDSLPREGRQTAVYFLRKLAELPDARDLLRGAGAPAALIEAGARHDELFGDCSVLLRQYMNFLNFLGFLLL